MRNIAAQRHRMNRVLNFARDHVADTLNLEAMADVACFSKFHFSRVFQAHYGESPTQCLARIRLELAARKLVYVPDLSITQVALECGFSGSDTFARSFRSRFGSSPRVFKASNQWCCETLGRSHPLGKEIYRPKARVTAHDATNLRVRIERRPEYRVAYIRHIGPYGDVNDSISKTFIALQTWARRKGLLGPETSYAGLNSDNCGTTPAHLCMYDACILLPYEMPEDDVVSVRTIPPGTYAVMPVRCKPAQLHGMWTWLTSIWLPQSGKKMSFRPNYEFFQSFGDRSANSQAGAELCLSIEDLDNRLALN